MAQHGCTTEALFLRNLPERHENNKVEKWQKVEDNPENRSNPNVEEYNNEVLDRYLLGELADSNEIPVGTEFIKFKNTNGSAGLIDRSAMQTIVRTARNRHRQPENPSTRNVIGVSDQDVIMLEQYPAKELDRQLNQAIIFDDKEAFRALLPIMDSSPGVHKNTYSHDIYKKERDEFVIKNNAKKKGSLERSIFSYHRLEMYKLLLKSQVRGGAYNEKFFDAEPFVSLAMEYNWVIFLDFIGKKMINKMMEGFEVYPAINDELGWEFVVGSPTFKTREQVIHKWLERIVEGDAENCLVWLMKNFGVKPSEYYFGVHGSISFKEYASSQNARKVLEEFRRYSTDGLAYDNWNVNRFYW